MSRHKRNEIVGAIFHLWIRRIERSLLFVDEDDYGRYLAELGRCALERNWLVLEFCLMPNHVHLVIQVTGPNLAAGMRDLHRRYVRGFNDRHGRSGRLFEHRPGWKEVADGLYLATVLEYVARNPVRASLCVEPQEWPWSRHGLIASRLCPPWLASDDAIRELKDGTRFRL